MYYAVAQEAHLVHIVVDRVVVPAVGFADKAEKTECLTKSEVAIGPTKDLSIL